MKLRDSIIDAKTNALGELIQIDEVVRQKDQHRVIVGIRLPPTAPGTGPTNRTHTTTTPD